MINRESPSFSVLCAIYKNDRACYLDLALLSLINQSVVPDQVVIVEDGPVSPALKSVLDKYRSLLNITSVRLPSNRGLAAALNAGLQYCEFELVARMDPDDISLQNRFELSIQFMSNDPDVDILGSNITLIDAFDNDLGLKVYPSKVELFDMMFSSKLCHPSVVFKKSKILAVGGYNESLIKSQDWDLWLRCLKNDMCIINIQECLLKFRVSLDLIARRKAEQKFNRLILREYFSWPHIILPLIRSFAITLIPSFFFKYLLKIKV